MASRYSNEDSSLTTVELLLRNGADPNAKDNCGWTPLHEASRYCACTSSLETVELLLRNGADPNAKDSDGWTPLYCASRSRYFNSDNSLETVKLLLQYNATPIDIETQILKLEIDIESLVEANKRLKQRIKILEDEVD